MQQWLSSFITNVVTLSNDWKLKKYLDSPAMILQLVDIRTQLKSTKHQNTVPICTFRHQKSSPFHLQRYLQMLSYITKKIISISKLTFQYSNKKKLLTIENLQFNLYRKKKERKPTFTFIRQRRIPQNIKFPY